MKIRQIRVVNFRNIGFAELNFSRERAFLLGENGQGKTNLLEAASLLTALRSFRTREQKTLIKHGEKQAQIAFEIDHELHAAERILLTLKSDGTKIVELDNGRILSHISDFVGRFPVVVFSSEDIRLLRGSPSLRRRWFDLTISAVDANYLEAIRRYKRALDSRNALLKRGESVPANAQIVAFDEILSALALEISRSRAAAVEEISRDFERFSEEILQMDVPAKLAYKPNVSAEIATVDAWKAFFEKNRQVDFLLRATQKGPHRDDFAFELNGVPASDFASEGQQRAITLALGLAQLSYFRRHIRVAPVILADDVLGELDPARREHFWREIGDDLQVIATGTEFGGNAGTPNWRVFDVLAGTYSGRE